VEEDGGEGEWKEGKKGKKVNRKGTERSKVLVL